MFKKLILILIVLFVAASCEKDREDKNVLYFITDSESGFDVIYRNENGNILSENVLVAGKEDEWEYSFSSRQGEIVYVSACYKDINSGIKVMVLIDDKIYKSGSSEGDTIKYVTVSGTIPY